MRAWGANVATGWPVQPNPPVQDQPHNRAAYATWLRAQQAGTPSSSAADRRRLGRTRTRCRPSRSAGAHPHGPGSTACPTPVGPERGAGCARWGTSAVGVSHGRPPSGQARASPRVFSLHGTAAVPAVAWLPTSPRPVLVWSLLVRLVGLGEGGVTGVVRGAEMGVLTPTVSARTTPADGIFPDHCAVSRLAVGPRAVELRDNGGPRTRGASLALMTDPQLRLRVGRPSLSAPRHLPCPRLPDRPHRLDNRAPVTAGRTSQSRVSQGGARALHLLVALSWWSPSWPTYTESNDSGDGLPIYPARYFTIQSKIILAARHTPSG